MRLPILNFTESLRLQNTDHIDNFIDLFFTVLTEIFHGKILTF